MRLFKRYLSVLLVLPVLFVVFSLPVSAETIDTSNYKVNIYSYLNDNLGNYGQVNIKDGESGYNHGSVELQWQNRDYIIRNRLTFADSTGATMFKAGKTYTFSVDNLYFIWGLYTKDNSTVYAIEELQIETVKSVNINGSETYLNNTFEYTFNPATGNYSLTGKFTPDEDVYKIIFYMKFPFNPATDLTASQNVVGLTRVSTCYYGTQPNTDNVLALDIEVKSEESGLLDGILGWIKNIFNTVEETWRVISAGFANIGTWFAELPGKIWQVMENGIKGLFVPDDQYMASYSDKWDQLLASRFGAVYQVCDIVIDSWDSIMSADQTNTINIPKVTIPLAGSSFSFGGYDVKIVPDGFSALVQAVKLIFGIVCTYLFINGLLKRYDELMGVES